jgi:hypothetical protein
MCDGRRLTAVIASEATASVCGLRYVVPVGSFPDYAVDDIFASVQTLRECPRGLTYGSIILVSPSRLATACTNA